MKHLNKLFAAVLMFTGLSSQAQDSNNPWAISFGTNAVDTRVSAATKVEDQFSQYFNVNDNWNILPSVSYINVSRNVGGSFSFGITGSVNRIKRWVEPRLTIPGDYPVINPGDLSYYAADGVIKYSFANMFGWKVIDPSINIGGGYASMGKASFGTANGGFGLTFWFTEMVGLSFQSTYKYSFDSDSRIPEQNVPSHMQHFAGLTFKFGGKDTDGDGIYDKDDACPEVAGLKQFKGCPDTDGDGIIDGSDTCPDVPGLAEFQGCPDTDADGIADKDDACPDVAGPKSLNGCPDADGDSDVKGTVSNKGCPEISEEQVNKLNAYAKTILFNSGKSTFQQQTFPVLQSIAAILKEYPDSKFSIEGHTDSDGKDAANQKLSEDRAKAVKDYLVTNGIVEGRLTSTGYGETKPIDSIVSSTIFFKNVSIYRGVFFIFIK
jgi:OmpA-OmpF porin, OOP family